MDKKKIEKLGKLIAESQKGGLLLQDQVDRIFQALPGFTEDQVDKLISTLQAGVVNAKVLEEAGVRFENVDVPRREEALEKKQEALAEELMETTLNDWKRDADDKVDELATELGGESEE